MLRTCTQVFVLFLLITASYSSGHAQRDFGVVWDVPDSEKKARQQADRFLDLGIRHIELGEPVSNPVLQRLLADSVSLYLAVPLQFLLPSNLSHKDSLYRHHLKNLIGHYREYPHIGGVGLFRFSATFSPKFREFIQIYASVLSSQYDYSVYYTTTQSRNESLPGGINWTFHYYQPQKDPVWSQHRGIIYNGSFFKTPYRELGYILEQTRSTPNRPIFFTDQWLLNAANTNPQFVRYLKTATRDSIALYPFGSKQSESANSLSNYLVLFLLIIWAIFALHYSFSPIYRRNLLRYFYSHKFFIRDILDWRIRITDTANILFLQHLLISGVWIYALARRYYSPLGEEALKSHLPYLSDLTIWPITLFIFGIILAFIIQTLCILWLYLFEKRIYHIAQTILLYSWPLHINLLVLTILTPLLISGVTGSVLFFLTVIFVLIWLGSFYVAALDISSSTPHVKVTYLLGTILPYSVLIITGFFYTLYYTDIPVLLKLIAFIS